MSSYVRIDAEANPCDLAFFLCQFVDNLKLCDTFNVEAEDIPVQSEVYLPVRLAHTGIDYLLSLKPIVETSPNLSTTNAVGTKSCLADYAQDLGIGIGLDGVVHNESIMLARLLINCLERLAHQSRVIVVEWCLYLLKSIYREFTFHLFGIVYVSVFLYAFFYLVLSPSTLLRLLVKEFVAEALKRMFLVGAAYEERYIIVAATI